MTIELKSNPASQLAEILEAFRNLAPKTNRAIDVWMKVLEADGQTVINKICELRLLIECVENLILNDPNVLNKPRHLEWVSGCKLALSIDNLYVGAKHTADNFVNPNQRGMASLDFCIEALSKSASEKVIEADVLNNLRELADELLQDVLKNVEEADLRTFLADLLQCFTYGIKNYQIRGSYGLDETISLVLGRLVRENQRYTVATSNTKNKFQQIWNFLLKLTKTVNDVKNMASTAQIGYEKFEEFQAVLNTPLALN